jgi:hypothetical protein
MAKRLTILAILLLVPCALFASPATPPAPISSAGACPTAAAPTASAAVDFATWLKNQDQAPRAAASCGSNFCTTQQRTQCNQQCGTRPHVGLQCCTSSCTTICNCGSVPIGC